MKKIVNLLILILAFQFTNAQITQQQSLGSKNTLVTNRGVFKSDSAFQIATRDTINHPYKTLVGTITRRPQDGNLYITNGLFWKSTSIEVVDSSNTLKQRIADTSAALRAAIGTGGGGATYTAGYGINIASNIIKADTTGTNGLATRFKLDTIFTHLRKKDVDSMYRDVDVTKVRKAFGILRPVVSGNNITWTFINDNEHKKVWFTTATTPNNSTVRINYPYTIKKILGVSIVNDETFVKHSITAGASVGLDYMDIVITTSNVIRFSQSALTSTTAVVPPFCSSASVSGTEISYTINGDYQNTEIHYGGAIQAMYAGSNNRYVRPVLSGLGYGQSKFELVDPTNGNVVAPNSNDKLLLYSPYRNEILPTQTVGGNLLADKIYTTQANFWVMAEFEIF